MLLLWFAIILLPVFTIIAIRTKMIYTIRAKIIITCISIISIIFAFAYCSISDKLETSNTTLDYVIDRDTSYLECINEEDNIDDIVTYCVIPLTKELSEIYNSK